MLISLRRLVPWSLRQHFLALNNGNSTEVRLALDFPCVQVQMNRGAASPSTVASGGGARHQACVECASAISHAQRQGWGDGSAGKGTLMPIHTHTQNNT